MEIIVFLKDLDKTEEIISAIAHLDGHEIKVMTEEDMGVWAGENEDRNGLLACVDWDAYAYVMPIGDSDCYSFKLEWTKQPFSAEVLDLIGTEIEIPENSWTHGFFGEILEIKHDSNSGVIFSVKDQNAMTFDVSSKEILVGDLKVWGVNKYGQLIKENDMLECTDGGEPWTTYVMQVDHDDGRGLIWHRERDYFDGKVVGSYNDDEIVYADVVTKKHLHTWVCSYPIKVEELLNVFENTKLGNKYLNVKFEGFRNKKSVFAGYIENGKLDNIANCHTLGFVVDIDDARRLNSNELSVADK